MQEACERTDGQVVAVDGKCLRGSHERSRGLGASAPGQHLGPGPPPSPGSGCRGTRPTRPELLRMLVRKGCIVTLDAMGCQKAIARQIRKQGADYVLRVRDNHKGGHARLQDTFALEQAGDFAGYSHDYADMVGKDHGRIETRRCWTTGTPDWEWRDQASLVRVESERHCGNRVTADVRIFISSLPPKARLQLQAGRRHWNIENAHHWVMDVAFGEDACRIRTGQAAHNLLWQDRSLKVSIDNYNCSATVLKVKSCQPWARGGAAREPKRLAWSNVKITISASSGVRSV